MPDFVDPSLIPMYQNLACHHAKRFLAGRAQHRRSPTRVRFGIIIEQRHKLTPSRRNSLIIRRAKSPIFPISNQPDFWKLPLHQFRRSIGGAVIYNNYFDFRFPLRRQRCQALSKQFAPIPIHNNY